MDNTAVLVNEQQKKKFTGWVKLAALGVAGFLIAPVIFVAIGGILGLAVAGAIAFTLVQFAPWFALKIANAKYRAMDAEKVSHIQKVTSAAAENPIETLTSLLIAKRGAFKNFEESVIQAATARSNFEQKVVTFKKRYPERSPEFEKQLSRMSDLVERKKVALADAKQSLEDGDMKLEEMKAYYEMSKDAIEANRAAGMDTGDAFEKLKADTACDAVFESMNMAFAQLEVAAALDVEPNDNEHKSPAQLAHNEPAILEIPAVQVRETVARKQ
jgi:hypothetical protein